MSLFHRLISALLLLPLFASAHMLQQEQRVPATGVNDRGELVDNHHQLSYQNWNTAQLPGRVRVIQHIAGRTSAKEMNAPLIDAIKQATLPHDRYQTTTIINTDDAIIGTSSFVRSSIEESKREFPWSQFIVDSQGVVKKAWGLNANSSAIIVLDPQGYIKFAKEGPLTPEEVRQVMSLLHQLLGQT